MQRLEQAVAVFCTACICAELTLQFVGEGWGHKCIKLVAGLYILVVLARMLPTVKLEWQTFSAPQAEAASFGTWSALVTSEAKRQLEQNLQQQWNAETGGSMVLDITLLENGDAVTPIRAAALLPASCTPEQQQAASEFLQTMLGLSEAQIEIRLDPKEAAP